MIPVQFFHKNIWTFFLSSCFLSIQDPTYSIAWDYLLPDAGFYTLLNFVMLLSACSSHLSRFLQITVLPWSISSVLPNFVSSANMFKVSSLSSSKFLSHWTIFSPIVLKVGFLTANHCSLRPTTVQPIFLPLNCAVIHFTAHEFDCKSTVWDCPRSHAKVKECHLHHSPSMHTSSSPIEGDRLVSHYLPLKGQGVHLRLLSWRLNCEKECSVKRAQRWKRPLVPSISVWI